MIACALAGLAFATGARADEDFEAKKAQGYLKAGLKRIEEGKYKEALSACKRGFEHKPLVELRACIAVAAFGADDRETAQKELRAYLKEKPKDAPPPVTIPPELAKLAESGDVVANKAAPQVEETPERCTEGKLVTAATGGHCCWPEQVWSDDQRICIGIPRCPKGFKLATNDCIRQLGAPSSAGCPPGKVSTGGHCCWREQVWGENGCIGVPSCPKGWQAKGRDCAPQAKSDE